MAYKLSNEEHRKINWDLIEEFIFEHNKTSWDGKPEKWEELRCPCKDCEYTVSSGNSWDNPEAGFRSHIYRTILFRADSEHIKLLLRIYGKSTAVRILKEMCLRSRMVSEILKKEIKKLEVTHGKKIN